MYTVYTCHVYMCLSEKEGDSERDGGGGGGFKQAQTKMKKREKVLCMFAYKCVHYINISCVCVRE